MIFVGKVWESGLGWLEHMQKRDAEYTRNRMMRLELADKMNRGRPRKW